jgi:DDE superfamily endonuclease
MAHKPERLLLARLWPFFTDESLTWRQIQEVVLLALSPAFVCFCVPHVCSVVFRSRLAASPGAVHRSDTRSGKAHRHDLFADHGLAPGAPFRQLSSGAEPCSLERACRESPFTRSAGPAVCAARSARVGMDDAIERRRGQRIQAKGIYRDPVRSSHSHLVKASGLRWVSLILLAPVPWVARIWALPFLTCLAPSERYAQKHRKQHKPVLHWARQMGFQAQRWLPHRTLVVVGDSAFSALAWLQALAQRGITVVTRLHLEAALYEPAPVSPRARTDVRGRRESGCLHFGTF